MRFRETPLRPGLRKEDRDFLRNVSNYLARQKGADSGQDNPSAVGTPVGKPFGNKVIFERRVGEIISRLASDTANTLRFYRDAAFRPSDSIKVPNRIGGKGDLQSFISDGEAWWHYANSATLFPTFIPIGKFPNTLASGNVSAAVQNAIDSMDEGEWLYFHAGNYQLDDTLSITRSNIGIWLAPGAHLQGNNVGAAGNVIEIGGTIDTLETDVTVDIAEREFFSITVVDTTGFADGDWIFIWDDEKPTISIQPEHRHINRIDKVVDGTHFKLQYPTSDSYAVADNARIRRIYPVENVHVAGGGTISNAGTPPGGGHGLRIGIAVDCTVHDLNFRNVRQESLKFIDVRDCSAINVRFGPADRFDSNGYGITVQQSVGVQLIGHRARRVRHAFDISFFSHDVDVVDCWAHSSPYTPFQVHPKCKRIKFDGCMVDGVAGYDNADPTSMVELGGNLSHGFAVREENEDITWVNGMIANTAANGASLDNDGCKNVRVANSFFYRTGTSGGTRAAIYCRDAEGIAATFPGLVVEDNILFECYSVGIFLSFDDALAKGNVIINMQKGTDSPTAVSSFSRAIGVLLSVVDRSGTAPAVTPVRMRSHDNLVLDLNGRLDRGIQLGGTEFVGSLTSNWVDQLLVGLESVNDRVYRSQGAGIWACPELESSGGFTALITLRDCLIQGGVATECNQLGTDSNEASGIMADDIGNVDPDATVTLDNCRAIRCRRIGMEVGFNSQRVRNCVADGTTAVLTGAPPVPVAGLGIFVRTTGAAIEDVLLENCAAHGNDSDGFRIGTPGGAGTLAGVRLVRPTMTLNGGHGINLCDNGSGTLVASPVGVGNTTADIAVDQNDVKITSPVLDGATVGLYGIDITAGTTGTSLHNVYSFDHATANVRDLGTGTAYLGIADVANGRLGVGTLTPGQLLDVNGIAQINQLIVNDAGADLDTRMEGDSDANLFYLDASSNSIGIGTTTPDVKFHIQGNARVQVTGIDAFRVGDAGGSEDFHVNTDDRIIRSAMLHEFSAVAHISGGLAIQRDEVSTTPFPVTVNHSYLAVDTSTSAITLELPALSGLDIDMTLWVKNLASGSNNVTITPDGAETIDGAGTLVLTPGQSVMLQGPNGGTDWDQLGPM